MKNYKKKILFITEDFPSGLSGNSVRTRNTLSYLLDNGFNIDLCCLHFEEFEVHDFKHPNLKIFTIGSKRVKKTSFNFIIILIKIIFSFIPITIRRLFNKELNLKINELYSKNKYSTVFFDGYSTLQYLHKEMKVEKIYIDDEDFTDLFWQRLILENKSVKKLFYFHEYAKSLIYEFFYMKKLDQIWAISPKTKKRLKKVSGVKTFLMPTIIPLQKNLYKSNIGQRIIFTGTLNWRENVEGLKWFIYNHWNYVLRFMPNAELVIIGQGASKRFISYLNNYKNIIYKGYVKNLEDEYNQASLSIAPVRINAGIKVKILTYMSYGLPVVSTEKAALGLVSKDGILVSKDKDFAKYIIVLLRNKKLRKILSKKAHNNIRKNYSEKVLGYFLSRELNIHE